MKTEMGYNMIKICLVSPIPPPYGGVANWEEIIRKESERNSDICIFNINTSPNKRQMDGRTIFDRVVYSGLNMLKAYKTLRIIIKENSPNVVHITTSGGLGFYRDLLLLRYLKRKKVPSIYHVHFGRTTLYKEQGGRCWRQIRKAVSFASFTIVLDKKTYDLLKPYANEISIINNPISTKDFKKYNNQTHDEIITYIGWIIKEKGIEELLSAFSLFREKHANYKLQLIGPGKPEYITFLQEAYDTTNVVFTGEVSHEDAMNSLAYTTLFVLPSYTEGFPNVILEAMSMRKCIIATNVGAIPEILSENAGVIIPSHDILALEEAMDKLINDRLLRDNIADNAYKKVCDEYDVDITFKKYLSVWSKYSN